MRDLNMKESSLVCGGVMMIRDGGGGTITAVWHGITYSGTFDDVLHDVGEVFSAIGHGIEDAYNWLKSVL